MPSVFQGDANSSPSPPPSPLPAPRLITTVSSRLSRGTSTKFGHRGEGLCLFFLNLRMFAHLRQQSKAVTELGPKHTLRWGHLHGWRGRGRRLREELGGGPSLLARLFLKVDSASAYAD